MSSTPALPVLELEVQVSKFSIQMPRGTADVWVESVTPWVRWGRAYFAVQSVAGLFWWTAVFVSPGVREATLGNLDPAAVAVLDIPLFVLASAVAAFGAKAAALVSTGWTGVVAVALAVYATINSEAGWGVLTMGAATAGSLIALCLVWLGRVPTAWIIRGPFAFRSRSVRVPPRRQPPDRCNPRGVNLRANRRLLGVLPGGHSAGHSGSRTALGGGAPVSAACRSCRCHGSLPGQLSRRLGRVPRARTWSEH